MSKNLRVALTTVVGVGLAFVVGALAVLVVVPRISQAAEYPPQSTSDKTYASSTAITLSWGRSINVVGTSTQNAATAPLPKTGGRTALTLQTVNCSAGNTGVYLQFNDVSAGTTTGMLLTGSSTRTFGQDVPMVTGAIKAIAAAGDCTLLVTEFRGDN